MTERQQGFQKPIDSGKRAKVKVAIIKYAEDHVSCSCGWLTYHQRRKVVEDRIDRHLAKNHGGRGLRL